MKKLLILVFALLLCLMATSALAAEMTLTGTINECVVIDQPGEHTIILDGVTINGGSVYIDEWYYSRPAIELKSPATKVTIVLKNGTENILKSGTDWDAESAGIENNGVELVICCESAGEGHKCSDACGKMILTGSNTAAGIGSGRDDDFTGKVIINGGTVTVEESLFSAGIGAGDRGDFAGEVIINGGIINVNCTFNGAGIGAGRNGNFSGAVVIAGGTVTAGSFYGAGIGSGDGAYDESNFTGSVTITGGTVIATSEDGAGIGSGYGNYGESVFSGNITISGGMVTAEGGNYGAGIGAGWYGTMSGTVTISGGTVTAKSHGSGWGAGIGAGWYGTMSGKLVVKGGDVTAIGGGGEFEYYPAIGAAQHGTMTAEAQVYVDPIEGVIGVKQGNSEANAANLEGAPYAVKTDLIPLLNRSRYVRFRHNPESETPTSCYGGTATCVNLAVCDDCSKPYGELNKKNHVHKVILPYVPPTTTSTGLTEGLKCGDCDTIIIPQQIIPMLPTDLPQTGDSTSFVLLASLALVGMIGMTVIIRKKNEA